MTKWSFLSNLLLGLVSSGLLVVCSPDFHYGFVAWIGLVPLLFAIRYGNLKQNFGIPFVCGLVFFTGLFRWVLAFPGFTFLHQAILGVYVGTYFGVFGLVVTAILRRLGTIRVLLAVPFIWVSLEYIRCNMSFMSLPWGVLAHSQHTYPKLIQIASITGVYGVSFLIVLVNVAITAMLLHFAQKIRSNQALSQCPSRVEAVVIAGIAFIMTSAGLMYGLVTDSMMPKGKGVKISVVQGNIVQKKKWDPKYAKFIMQTYANLTHEASKARPELIVWPEAATPRAINEDHRVYAEVRRITREVDARLLLGSAQQRKFEKEGEVRREYLNSAFLVAPALLMEKTQRYDKIRLIPFGEYTPFQGRVPWSYLNVPKVAGFVSGEEFTVFEHPDFRFGVAICWETIFPELVRQFVKSGAQFMINITNEAWFGKTEAPYQFLAMNVFRAVENRVYLVRCANTGVSCFIDPYGRIVERMRDENGQDIFVRGVLTGKVIPCDYKTIYTRYGDWFAWLCILCSVGFVLAAIFKKRPNPLK